MKNELVELIPTTSHCTLHSKRNDQQNKKAAYENRKGLWKPYVCVGVDIVVVQLFVHVLHFAVPWTAEIQAFLSFTISWSLLKLMSTETVLTSLIPISSCPASGSFLVRWLFMSTG